MKVLFVCVQGLSSAIVVNALKKQAKKENVDIEVLSVSIREFEREIDKGWNLAMIAPQVMHKYDHLNKVASEKGVPCILIEKDAYGPKTGDKLLKQVMKFNG